jgi:hypothetical protein
MCNGVRRTLKWKREGSECDRSLRLMNQDWFQLGKKRGMLVDRCLFRETNEPESISSSIWAGPIQCWFQHGIGSEEMVSHVSHPRSDCLLVPSLFPTRYFACQKGGRGYYFCSYCCAVGIFRRPLLGYRLAYLLLECALDLPQSPQVAHLVL